MIKLVICLILSTAAAAYKAETNFLDHGRFDAKLERLTIDLNRVAGLTQNLSLEASICKKKFIDMSNEFMHSGQNVNYEMNQAIPSIKDEHIHDGVVEVLDGSSKLMHQIQLHLHANHQKLHQCMTNGFNEASGLTHRFAIVVRKIDSKNEIYLANQLQKSLNIALFAVQKFTLQTQFLVKTNKELVQEIDAGVEGLCKTLQNLKNDDYQGREELINSIQHFQDILDFAIVKLDNFVHLNSGDENYISTVKGISEALSTLSDTLHHIAPESIDYTTEFEKLYKGVTNEIKKLLQIELGENTIGELNIRSVLFDSITASYVFERELSSSKDI